MGNVSSHWRDQIAIPGKGGSTQRGKRGIVRERQGREGREAKEKDEAKQNMIWRRKVKGKTYKERERNGKWR